MDTHDHDGYGGTEEWAEENIRPMMFVVGHSGEGGVEGHQDTDELQERPHQSDADTEASL